MIANGPERPADGRSEATGSVDGTAVRFDEETGAYETTVDWGRTSPTVAVVELVATATGTEPATLSPLGDVLDPDHLNGLLVPTRPTPSRHRVRVRFDYEGFEVSVAESGHVVARPTE